MRLFTKKILLPAVALLSLTLSSCQEDVSVTVKTNNVTNVGSTHGTFHGTVTYTGVDILEAGVVYSSTVVYPKLNNSRFTFSADLSTLPKFKSEVIGLNADSAYRYRAYVRTADSTYYGSTYSFKPVAFTIEMVSVTGGTFSMGATGEQPTDALSNEKPVHQVQVGNFQIGKYEVTNAQFAIFLNSRGASAGGYCTTEDGSQNVVKAYERGLKYNADSVKWMVAKEFENLPVVNVTWFGAREFCKWAGGRLPTEAEWEYAARGGSMSAQPNYIYSGSNDPAAVAWFKLYGGESSPVKLGGTKDPNELGLFDMSGNVSEWVSDWYDAYLPKALLNPKGMTDDEAENAGITKKVMRGGGWADPTARMLRVSARSASAPELPSGSGGFRVAMDNE